MFDLKAITRLLLQPGVLPVFLVKVICGLPIGESGAGVAGSSGVRSQEFWGLRPGVLGSAAGAPPFLCPASRAPSHPGPQAHICLREGTAHRLVQAWVPGPGGGQTKGLPLASGPSHPCFTKALAALPSGFRGLSGQSKRRQWVCRGTHAFCLPLHPFSGAWGHPRAIRPRSNPSEPVSGVLHPGSLAENNCEASLTGAQAFPRGR